MIAKSQKLVLVQVIAEPAEEANLVERILNVLRKEVKIQNREIAAHQIASLQVHEEEFGEYTRCSRILKNDERGKKTRQVSFADFNVKIAYVMICEEVTGGLALLICIKRNSVSIRYKRYHHL